MAERLCKAISGVRKINCTSKTADWARYFYQLHKTDGVSTKRIKRVLKWYCAKLPDHHREQFFPVVESGRAFREKFSKLERAMDRPEWNGGEERCDSESERPKARVSYSDREMELEA